MSPSITSRSTPLLIAAAVLALALLAGLSLWAGDTYTRRLEDVRHTVEVQRQIAVVLSAAQDAETGQRGYLLSGEDDFLRPYREARLRLPAEMKRLEALTADNPAQRQATARLDPLIRDRFSLLERSIGLRRAGQAAAAADVGRLRSGKASMDRLRTLLAQMSAREAALLEQRSAASQTANRVLAALIALLTLGIVAGLTVALSRAWAMARRLREEMAEREAVEDRVRQMQKTEAVGQLTGGIAHDFNNMLAIIIGNLELARRRLDDRPKLEKALEQAMGGASRAATLTRRLLAFSRQQPLEPQVLDVNKLVSGMSDLMLRTLGEQIRVETVLAGGLWKTNADPSQIESALLNLAVNARDAMPDGGKLTIETSNAHLDDAYARETPEAKAGQYVLICVSDSGTGMPPEVIARAFDPFFTTKAVGKGTGLGLSQIHGFAKQTGGHARIYSEMGEGTTVKLYLPRYYGEDAAVSPERKAASSQVIEGSASQIILVVEDEESVRLVTVDTLRSLGYTVVHAGDGPSALDLLRNTGAVSLLFTDIVMPGMTGRQLADLATAERPGLKVLYTTGYTRNAVVHNGIVDPGVEFLAKPYTVEQLSQKVAQVLAG